MGRASLTAGHLHGLLQDCRQQPPHLLLLMGPFLDEEHPHIRSGTLDEHFEAVFEREVHLLLADTYVHLAICCTRCTSACVLHDQK